MGWIRLFGMILGLMCFSVHFQAQNSGTLPFMDLVPQSTASNPARVSPYRFTMGVPALGGLRAEVINNALSIDHISYRKRDTTYLDPSRLLSHLSENNTIGAYASVDVLRFGYQLSDRWYIHTGIDIQGRGALNFNRASMQFLLKGPGTAIDDKLASLNGNALHLNIFASYYIGASYEINRKIRLGLRGRYIIGLQNINSEITDLNIRIDNGDDPNAIPYQYTIQPHVLIRQHELGFSPKNSGFAFDIGACIRPKPEMAIDIAISDLGLIHWGAKPILTQSSGNEKTFIHAGFGSLGDLVGENGLDFSNWLGQLRDTLTEFLELKDTVGSAYQSVLSPRFRIGFTYDITPKDMIGIQWQGYFRADPCGQMISIAYSHFFNEKFGLSLSNSIEGQNFFNLGIGLSAQLGPIQLYAIVDKLNSIWVTKMRNFNIQIGMNLNFDYSHRNPRMKLAEGTRKYRIR